MRRKNNSAIGFILLVLLSGLASCKKEIGGEYHSLKEKIEVLGSDTLTVTLSSEPFLTGMPRVEVADSIHKFMIPSRKEALRSYPCSACHTLQLEDMKDPAVGKRAHWDISLQHAPAEVMNCMSCHFPESPDQLRSLAGSAIDFDHSYQLCGQCHFTQLSDWKGGAHGKRLGGWAPPRTSMTCVQCHNPHQPALPVRWPARYNSVMEAEREGGKP